MKEFNIKQLEILLSENKTNEAKQLLKDYFDEDLTNAEKGEVYVDNAIIYMKVCNEINQKYLVALKDIIASIKAVDSKKNEVGNRMDILSVKDQINRM